MKIFPIAEAMAKLLADGAEELRTLVRVAARTRHGKHHRSQIGLSDRSRREAAARLAHVARVREQNGRSADYFARHGCKPPRKLRMTWIKEIARDVASLRDAA